MVAIDPEMLIEEFKVSCNLRTDVARPLVHASLSLRPGLSLNSEEWMSAVACFLKEMGFTPMNEHQLFVIEHLDTKHQHIHLVVSRISTTSGALVRELFRDYRLAHRAAAAAAMAVGLAPITPSGRGAGRDVGGDPVPMSYHG